MSNYIKDNQVAQDEWATLPLPAIEEIQRKQAGKIVVFKLTGEQTLSSEIAADVIVPAGKIIIPLAVWLAQRDALSTRVEAGEIGVWLESYELIETLIDNIVDINELPVIALNFGKLADGRSYSAATLLRTRFGYRNELRAIGDVQRDQLFYMKRVGFNAYQIRADRCAQDALASLRDFSEPYQGAVDEPRPLWKRFARVPA